MHTALEHFEEKFDSFDNSYLMVVPAGGLRSGYDVLTQFNLNEHGNYDDLDDAIERAQGLAAMKRMDGVVAFHPPQEPESD